MQWSLWLLTSCYLCSLWTKYYALHVWARRRRLLLLFLLLLIAAGLWQKRTDQNIVKNKPECLDGLAAFQFSPQNKIKTNGKSSYLWNAKHPAGPTGLTVGLWVDVLVVLLVSWFFSADLRRMAAVVEQLHHFRIGKHLSRLKSAAWNQSSLCLCVCVCERARIWCLISTFMISSSSSGATTSVCAWSRTSCLAPASAGVRTSGRRPMSSQRYVGVHPLQWEEFRGEVHDGRRGSSRPVYHHIIVGTPSPHVSSLDFPSSSSAIKVKGPRFHSKSWNVSNRKFVFVDRNSSRTQRFTKLINSSGKYYK